MEMLSYSIYIGRRPFRTAFLVDLAGDTKWFDYPEGVASYVTNNHLYDPGFYGIIWAEYSN